MPVITTYKDGDVIVIVSDNPPVNALGAAVRQGLVEAIKTAAADDGVKAVVIVGARPDLLCRRRHHRVRQAARGARPAGRGGPH